MAKNRNGCFGHRTLKLAVYQEGMCWYKFRKTLSYFNNFWVIVVKMGVVLFRSCASKICCISGTNWCNELIFLHAYTNLEMLKVTLIVIGWTWSKMGDQPFYQPFTWNFFGLVIPFFIFFVRYIETIYQLQLLLLVLLLC